MNTRPILLILLLLLGLLGGFARADEPTPSRPTIPYLAASELRPGMKGYGLTVFHGTAVERFDVTIKGVIDNAFADGDMIIVEIDHPLIEGHGVIAGMSGSPVFIEDKIIGAVAYGWGFSVRPVCGVTPIENMFEVYSLVTDDSQVPSEESRATLRHWPELQSALSEQARFQRPPSVTLPLAEAAAMGLGSLAGGEAVVLEPLSAPLMVGTRSSHVMQRVNELFAGSLFQPVQAGLSGSRPGDAALADVEPENGSAFSVVLVEGDLHLAGLGTATVVEGDRLIGFGHPMMGTGAVDMPMALSEVVAVIPSVMRPFKIGNTVKEIGALRQDRLPAVGGTLSRRTTMVPLRVNVEAPETGTNKAFNFRVWRERTMLPQLMMICTLDSMERAARVSGPMNVQMDYRIALEDGRVLRKSEFLSGEDFVTVYSAMYLGEGLDLVMNNRFEPVDLAGVEVNVTMRPRIQVRLLKDMVEGRQTFQPGDTWRGEVEFVLWRNEADRLELSVPLPKDLRPGDYEIRIVDGATRSGLDRVFQPESAEIDSLEELLEFNRPDYPSDRLYILLVDPKEQLTLEGQKLPNLPRSVADLTRSTNISATSLGTVNARLLAEQQVPLDSMVVGNRTVRIKIDKK